MIDIKKSRNPHEKGPPPLGLNVDEKFHATPQEPSSRPLILTSLPSISSLFDRQSQFSRSDRKWRTLISAPDQANRNRNPRHAQNPMTTTPQKLIKYLSSLFLSWCARDIDGSTRVHMRLKRMHRGRLAELRWG